MEPLLIQDLKEYLAGYPIVIDGSDGLRVQLHTTVRRLSTQQWQTFIDTAEQLADEDPVNQERTLFMISALYGMYQRISELGASDR